MATTTSYNHRVASRNAADFGGLDNSVVPGTNGVRLAPGVRAGDVATIASWTAWQWHLYVEDLITPGCWGYFYKFSANSAALIFCHSSGTAWDLNAPAHPNGRRGTLDCPSKGNPTISKAQAVDNILAFCEGVVYSGKGAWGGGTVDEMHLEISEDSTDADVARIAAKIIAQYGPRETWAAGAQPVPPAPPVVPHNGPPPALAPTGPTFSEQARQDQFNLRDTGFDVGAVDGYWGDQSTAGCRAFQHAARISEDGICGDQTRAMLHKVPSWHGGFGAGDGGYSALEWQRQLKGHGWHIETDGVWGQHSAAILRQFQADKGISADGIRGPESWTTLHCTAN